VVAAPKRAKHFYEPHKSREERIGASKEGRKSFKFRKCQTFLKHRASSLCFAANWEGRDEINFIDDASEMWCFVFNYEFKRESKRHHTHRHINVIDGEGRCGERRAGDVTGEAT
jgi:hypothetical protein